MKRNLFIVAQWVLVLCAPQSAMAVTFDPTVRYSREVINARMSCWKNKGSDAGFPNANSTNGSTSACTSASWDYVPGVVAKGILDCWAYYQDSTWAAAWYEGLSTWALSKTAKNTGGSLDDLNCTKVFFGIYDGCKSGGKYETVTGIIKKYKEYEREIIMGDGTVIPVGEIIGIRGALLDAYFSPY